MGFRLNAKVCFLIDQKYIQLLYKRSISFSTIVMAMSTASDLYSLWLFQLTSNRLGQFVQQNYSRRADGSCRLLLGNAFWVGEPALTDVKARDSAAKAAYTELVFLPEATMRTRLMLPERPAVEELKDVRRTFDVLQFRTQTQLAGAARSFAMDKIAYVRFQVDTLEHDLLCAGLDTK